MAGTRGLKASATALADAYDSALLDLDGVVYIGAEAVDGVPAILDEIAGRGVHLAFVTNNAARTPTDVAHQLRDLGVDAHESDVVTSAQAAAALIGERVAVGSRVLVAGGEGLIVALRERGLVPVSSLDDEPVAVVQGFHPTVDWKVLAEASYAVSAGLLWVASNLDLTVPTGRGIAPGNGSLVNAVATATGRRPDAVAGKPFRPLFDETVRRIGGERPLVVGDRLDTDIEGAVNSGMDSLLVMTGVTDLEAACAAPSSQRPTFISWTMSGLVTVHPVPEQRAGGCSLGGWSVEVADSVVRVADVGDDRDDGLRAVVTAAWTYADEHPDAALELDDTVGQLTEAVG